MADYDIFGGRISIGKFNLYSTVLGVIEVLLIVAFFIASHIALAKVLPAESFNLEFHWIGWLLVLALTLPMLVAILIAKLYLGKFAAGLGLAPSQFIKTVFTQATGWPLAFALAIFITALALPTLVLSGSGWTATAVTVCLGISMGLGRAIVEPFQPKGDSEEK